MELKLFFSIFVTVFLAELGDKTQIATLLFASEAKNPKLIVFAASASALVLTSAIGVLVGSQVSSYVNTRYLSWCAGAGFIIIGIWTIVSAN